MSDSITKWHEINEHTDMWHAKSRLIVSEGHKKQAYQILVDYPFEAIAEAYRIAKLEK